MAVSLKFNIGTNYPENYPHNILITETDALNCATLKESFLAAQKAYVPYYSVAVVESGNEGERFYHIYDTAYFSRTNPEKDPITGRAIRIIHHFAIKCFQFDKDNICRPFDLLAGTVFLNYVPQNCDDDINTMLLDSTNANIFETGEPGQKMIGRRTQYSIADLIKKEELFPKLASIERQKETLQWLWCSAQGSYRGLVILAKECLRNKEILCDAEGQVIELLKGRFKSPFNGKGLTANESKAYMEAQVLLQSLKLNQSKDIAEKEQASLKKEESKSPRKESPKAKKLTDI